MSYLVQHLLLVERDMRNFKSPIHVNREAVHWTNKWKKNVAWQGKCRYGKSK